MNYHDLHWCLLVQSYFTLQLFGAVNAWNTCANEFALHITLVVEWEFFFRSSSYVLCFSFWMLIFGFSLKCHRMKCQKTNKINDVVCACASVFFSWCWFGEMSFKINIFGMRFMLCVVYIIALFRILQIDFVVGVFSIVAYTFLLHFELCYLSIFYLVMTPQICFRFNTICADKQILYFEIFTTA